MSFPTAAFLLLHYFIFAQLRRHSISFAVLILHVPCIVLNAGSWNPRALCVFLHIVLLYCWLEFANRDWSESDHV